MKEKRMDQRCKADKVLGNGNWEDYMWPHWIDKTPLLDPEVISFLKRLNLSKLTGIFENEEVLSMGILFKLNDEDLTKLGIKLVHRKIILEEISKLKQQPAVKPQEKMTQVKSPSSESSAPSPVKQQPMDASPAVETKSQVLPSPPARQQSASDPPFLLISSSGPAADHQSGVFGLYEKTEEMREGRSVYTQMHDTKYGDNYLELFSNNRVWNIAARATVFLRATTLSDSPTSVTWQYKELHKTWLDDPALTVTSLNEKPSCDCEVTISLSEDISWDIEEPGVVGLYKADGSYHRGRPVLQHQEDLFTLSVLRGYWLVSDGVDGASFLYSGSAPSQCPADPRAARNKRRGETHWGCWNKQRQWLESRGISVKCKKHKY